MLLTKIPGSAILIPGIFHLTNLNILNIIIHYSKFGQQIENQG